MRSTWKNCSISWPFAAEKKEEELTKTEKTVKEKDVTSDGEGKP